MQPQQSVVDETDKPQNEHKCKKLPSEIWSTIVFPLVGDIRCGILRSVCKDWRHLIKPNPKAMKSAAMTYAHDGHLSCLQWIVSNHPSAIHERTSFPLMSDVMPKVWSRFDHINAHWSKDLKSITYPILSNEAARGGHIQMLEWLKGINAPWDASTCAAAARGGHIDVLHWLMANGCPWDTSAYAAAAYQGHLNVLQWLREDDSHSSQEDKSKQVSTIAKAVGDVLVRLKIRKPIDEICTWDASVSEAAALGGHLEVLQWLIFNSCPWDESACRAAAQGGHLVVLQWLHRNGCPWDTWAITAAARTGQLDILQWLHANGCEVDPMMAMLAASGEGQLEALRWVIANGPPAPVLPGGLGTSLGVCAVLAAVGSHWEVLDELVLHDKTCLSKFWGQGAALAMISAGSVDKLEWITKHHGIVFDKAVYCGSAAEAGQLIVLKWLREKDCPWDATVYAAAIKGGHEEVLQWLKENGCPQEDVAATKRAPVVGWFAPIAHFFDFFLGK